MTVSNSWLVNVNVNINTTTAGVPAFNNCMLIGVMPTQTTPYQSPPASWVANANLYQNYTSLAAFNTDFSPLIAGALAQGDLYQLARFYWLSNSVTAFFEQSPTPFNLYVGAIPPQTSPLYSTCVVQIVTSGMVTIPAGTIVTPTSPATSAYVLLEPFIAPSAATYSVTFYSVDVTNVIAASHFTAISPTLSAVTGVSNSAGATLGIAGGINYITLLNTLTTAQNSWYGLEICDLILAGGASGYSSCIVELTTSGAVTIPAGTVVTPETATASYTLLQAWELPAVGTYLIPFFSTDGTTQVTVGVAGTLVFNAISPAISGVTVTGNLASIKAIPGFTSPNGLVPALAALRSATNQKMAFQDTLDYTIAGAIQAAGGSKDLSIFFHSINLQAPVGYIPTSVTALTLSGLIAQFSAASLGEYFTDLFNTGIGLKPISSMQLSSQPVDPFITTANIGTVGQAGSSTNIIGYTNNVYAGFGAPPGIGLVQYGYTTASQFSSEVITPIYIDQVVGATYLQFVAQADLVAYIIAQQPTGGVLYNDFGIQQILNVFRGSVNKAVNQNILQPPMNSAYVYYTYAQVQALDPNAIANRIYKDLTFNGKFLSRIQQIALTVNLSL